MARLGSAFALLAFATTALAGPNRKKGRHKNQCLHRLDCWLTILLVLLAIVLGALGVFVAIVLGFAWFVAVVPALTLATAGVGIAPPGANVISQALSAARKDWALVSGAFYLAYLLVIGLGIASAVVGLIPILGIFANLAISFVSYTVFVIVQHFQWLRIGGEVDPAIAEMTGTA